MRRVFSALQHFMADAGHVLGTPLSIILANAESIEADIPKDSIVTMRLETITRSSERMNSLVSDMMLLAKMEGESILTKARLVDLGIIVHESVVDFAELFKTQGVKLVEGQLQSAALNGDIESLKRLITYLLQNALKYTNSGGTVKFL